MTKLILCSQSARRRQILTDLNLKFELETPNINESELAEEKPLDYLKRISKLKVKSIFNKRLSKEEILLSSDTIVVSENSILHKPINLGNAIEILTLLSGKAHYVHSSFYLFQSNTIEIYAYDSTKVHFRAWNNDEIRNYVLESQPFDKAGSYGIQDKTGPVEKIEGSYTNVLGFPIRKFMQDIEKWKHFIL
jgi:septum formation protein